MEMNFKEAYQDDLANLFFDEEELASRHNIDGVEYTIILMDMENQGHESIMDVQNQRLIKRKLQ